MDQSITQAIQKLMGNSVNQLGFTPTAGQSAQMNFDPNQLWENLLRMGFQNRNKSFASRNHVVQRDMSLSPLTTEGQHGITSQATTQAIQNGANPTLLDQARSWLGKNAYVGLCEAFVERMTNGAEGLYRSAQDAWNQHQNKVQGTTGMRPGDAVYFGADPSNGMNGHTGVYMGNGEFVSATNNGIRQYNLNDWQKTTGQKLLGYVPEGQHTPTPMRQQGPMASQPQTQAVGQPNALQGGIK